MEPDEAAEVPGPQEDCGPDYAACWVALRAELWSILDRSGYRQIDDGMRRRDYGLLQQAGLLMTNIAGILALMHEIELRR
jgi:hypothetical protein